MNAWHDLSPQRITPTKFSALIEIPKGSNCKYEMDKDTGLLRLDRILYTATQNLVIKNTVIGGIKG